MPTRPRFFVSFPARDALRGAISIETLGRGPSARVIFRCDGSIRSVPARRVAFGQLKERAPEYPSVEITPRSASEWIDAWALQAEFGVSGIVITDIRTP